MAGIFPFRGVAYLNFYFLKLWNVSTVKTCGKDFLWYYLIVGSEIEEAVDAIGVSWGENWCVANHMILAMKMLLCFYPDILVLVLWKLINVNDIKYMFRRTSIMAKDAIALMDHLGWKKAHVFGHSMGESLTLNIKLARLTPISYNLVFLILRLWTPTSWMIAILWNHLYLLIIECFSIFSQMV